MNLLVNSNTPFSGKQSYYPTREIGSPQNWNQMLPRWKQVLGEDTSSHCPTLNLLTNQNTAVSILTSILKKADTLASKCEQISEMLHSFSNKDLIEIYPQVLVEVFGFSGNDTFGLNKYEPTGSYYEFNAVYNFLSINGSLCNIINKLLGDSNAEFHFPYKLLPDAVVEKITTGQASLWYQKKLVVVNGDEVALSCNALEYYMLLFSYYVIHPRTLDQPSRWSGVEDILYIRLLEDYLRHFFPIGLDSSTSVMTQEVMHGSPNLLKSLINNKYGDHSVIANSPHGSMSGLKHITPSFHAEMVLQIFCDIWFGLNREVQLNRDEEYKLPSIDHARCVRILVKYMHTFVNGNSEVQGILFSSTYENQLDEFKGVGIPILMHKALYVYLKHCFTHWPLDASFRMVLETWLSFIQPWRYLHNNNMSVSVNDTLEINVSQWELFITEHILFYSNIFRMFLLRALRFDFTSLHDTKLVYRVSKVFSLSSLSQILHSQTKLQLTSKISMQSIGGSTFLGSPCNNRRIQFESPGNVVPSLFGPEIKKSVYDLCQKIVSTVIEIRQNAYQATHGKNILTMIKKYFYIDGAGFDDCEKHQLLEYLENACKNFSALFNMSEFQEILNNDEVLDISKDTTNLSQNILPDFKVTENGVQLTDVGRYQILHGIRQFPITYSGDPELQPLRSYEFDVAVKGLYWVACKLNSRYSTLLYNLYNRPCYVKFLHTVSKKLNTNHYIDTPFNLPQSGTRTDKVTPRISLRFAASYYFMGCVCWLSILAKMFGFGWLIIFFALFIFLLICIVVHVDSPPKKFKEN